MGFPHTPFLTVIAILPLSRQSQMHRALQARCIVSMNSEQQICHPRFWGKMRGTKRLFPPPVDGALHSAPVQNGIHILLRSGDGSQAVGIH